jgi:hypothetical protein
MTDLGFASVPKQFSTVVSRLAVGIEATNGFERPIVGGDVRAYVESGRHGRQTPVRSGFPSAKRSPLSFGFPELPRRDGHRWALLLPALYFSDLRNDLGPLGRYVVLRVVDCAGRYVARRLAIPLPDIDLHDPVVIKKLDDFQMRPADWQSSYALDLYLSPGAVIPNTSSVLSGRVLTQESGSLVVSPWARVTVQTANGATTVTRSQCDANGEFVVVLPTAATLAGPSSALKITAQEVTNQHQNGVGRTGDPLGRLPIETLTPAGVSIAPLTVSARSQTRMVTVFAGGPNPTMQPFVLS